MHVVELKFDGLSKVLALFQLSDDLGVSELLFLELPIQSLVDVLDAMEVLLEKIILSVCVVFVVDELVVQLHISIGQLVLPDKVFILPLDPFQFRVDLVEPSLQALVVQGHGLDALFVELASSILSSAINTLVEWRVQLVRLHVGSSALVFDWLDSLRIDDAPSFVDTVDVELTLVPYAFFILIF